MHRFGLHLGSILAPFGDPKPIKIASWGALGSSWDLQGAQEAPKRAQEAPKSLQRATQEAPKDAPRGLLGSLLASIFAQNSIQTRVFRLVLFSKCFLKRFWQFVYVFSTIFLRFSEPLFIHVCLGSASRDFLEIELTLERELDSEGSKLARAKRKSDEIHRKNALEARAAPNL